MWVRCVEIMATGGDSYLIRARARSAALYAPRGNNAGRHICGHCVTLHPGKVLFFSSPLGLQRPHVWVSHPRPPAAHARKGAGRKRMAHFLFPLCRHCSRLTQPTVKTLSPSLSLFYALCSPSCGAGGVCGRLDEKGHLRRKESCLYFRAQVNGGGTEIEIHACMTKESYPSGYIIEGLIHCYSDDRGVKIDSSSRLKVWWGGSESSKWSKHRAVCTE